MKTNRADQLMASAIDYGETPNRVGRCGFELIEHRQKVVARLQVPARMLKNFWQPKIPVPRLYISPFELSQQDRSVTGRRWCVDFHWISFLSLLFMSELSTIDGLASSVRS
ncbi:hypothetical protein A9R05_26420 [Burkholderia sp. KK1]|nr:hypothetical protein A9R05_26420 [Burkholderia sp. KK1]